MNRYSLVLQIFQIHANSPTSKLQVELAEIPYLKSRLLNDLEIENECKHSKQRKGRDWFDRQRVALNQREKRIKGKIQKIKAQRDIIRAGRLRDKLPTVAVVGYTNAGKSSLIKALSGTSKIRPEDKLFATLDVTCHLTALPSLTVGLLDTVGFISDIPTSLIACFGATLEDTSIADLIIHVRDVSHANHKAQSEHVLRTLSDLEVPKKLIDNMITVGNKIDLIHQDDWQLVRQDNMIPLSSKLGINMEELVHQLDRTLLQITGRTVHTFRVKTGGQQFQRLLKETSIIEVQSCQMDPNYSNVECVLFQYQIKQLLLVTE